MSFARFAKPAAKIVIASTPTNRERRARRFHVVMRSVLFLIIIGLGWLIIFSPLFDIQTFEVNGAQAISAASIQTKGQEQTQKKRWFIFPERNILFFDNEEFAKQLRQVRLARVYLEKKPWGRIIVNIEERKTVAWFQTATGEWWEVDEQGTALGQASIPTAGALQIKQDVSEENAIIVSSGTQILPAATLQGIRFVSTALTTSPLRLVNFSFTRREPTPFIASSADNWNILFNTALPLDEQVDKLLAFVRERQRNFPTDWRTTIHTVNLRFGSNRIYYQ